MKQSICLIVFILFVFGYASASELNTENFKITISVNCAEGEVTCDKVTYLGVNKKNGNSIQLNGETLHKPCEDGITPCRFLGYKFKNGDITYFVFKDGTLKVVKSSNEVLIKEKGEWTY